MAAARLSFSYPEELKEKLLALAKAERRSLSSYVQNIITDHLATKHAPRKSSQRRRRT